MFPQSFFMMKPRTTHDFASYLSARELEVLRFLAIGFNVPDIAPKLDIARSTVRSHIKNIYVKLGVHKRKEALRRARELELL
jgi:LuxR family maltose regulon positive regulatory protein